MIKAASDLYVHTVQAAPLTGQDPDHGTAVYGDDVEVTCLIAEEIKLIRAPDGSDQVSGTQVYAGPESGAALQLGARVTLPAAPHRPDGAETFVIGLSSVVVGDPAVDGVIAMCE